MNKKALGPGITFFPQPATWIVSVDKDGTIDVMTASWVSIVSKTPPTIALSLHHGRQTYANIQQSGVFTVNVIPSSQAVAGASALREPATSSTSRPSRNNRRAPRQWLSCPEATPSANVAMVPADMTHPIWANDRCSALRRSSAAGLALASAVAAATPARKATPTPRQSVCAGACTAVYNKSASAAA